jgi:hypothetical protein
MNIVLINRKNMTRSLAKLQRFIIVHSKIKFSYRSESSLLQQDRAHTSFLKITKNVMIKIHKT